jgi:putative hemolysin
MYFLLTSQSPKEEFYEELFEMKYSRIPVYEEEIDNIIGVLICERPMLKQAKEVGFENIDIRSILHEALSCSR